MNRASTMVSSGVLAAVVGAALLPLIPAASAAMRSSVHQVATHQPSTPVVGSLFCLPPWFTSGCGSLPASGGTSTPELPSGALIVVGLVPPLIVRAVWRRRRRPG
jgi:hypothetical protein